MDYHSIHQSISKQVREIMPSHLARLSWSRDQINSFQLQQLKALLSHAKTHSAYYQKHLKPIDIMSIQLDDLKKMPILTKALALKHWDDIICVPNINKKIAEAHLDNLRDNPDASPFLENKYYVTATGGSSGVRGLYAWDLDYFADIAAVDFRYQVQDENNAQNSSPRVTAVLTAPSPIHASTPLCTMQLNIADRIIHLPADLSIKALCTQLNIIKPTHLIGYASVITRLAREALQGRLLIRPKRATTNSEPLNDKARETIQKAWGIQPNNTWGSVEMGIAGIENDQHAGLILSEDMIIFEFVDEHLQPVTRPEAARKLIITNLFNQTLPLIRYVVDDVVEMTQSNFTAYHMTPNIAGRSDDWFIYSGNIEIHPMIFWDVFEREAQVSEYQVEQTKEGVLIRMVAYEKLDATAIIETLETALKKAGLTCPNVLIEQVETIPRHAETGKLKRFIPLTS